MGFFDKLANVLGIKKKECNVLVVGLDNSGKSSVLNHFKPEEQKSSEIVPTVGFNVERFKSRPISNLDSSALAHTFLVFSSLFCVVHNLCRICSSLLILHFNP